MVHSEQQYKMLEQQLQKMKKENELKDKEIKNDSNYHRHHYCCNHYLH